MDFIFSLMKKILNNYNVIKFLELIVNVAHSWISLQLKNLFFSCDGNLSQGTKSFFHL